MPMPALACCVNVFQGTSNRLSGYGMLYDAVHAAVYSQLSRPVKGSVFTSQILGASLVLVDACQCQSAPGPDPVAVQIHCKESPASGFKEPRVEATLLLPRFDRRTVIVPQVAELPLPSKAVDAPALHTCAILHSRQTLLKKLPGVLQCLHLRLLGPSSCRVDI